MVSHGKFWVFGQVQTHIPSPYPLASAVCTCKTQGYSDPFHYSVGSRICVPCGVQRAIGYAEGKGP